MVGVRGFELMALTCPVRDAIAALEKFLGGCSRFIRLCRGNKKCLKSEVDMTVFDVQNLSSPIVDLKKSFTFPRVCQIYFTPMFYSKIVLEDLSP